MRRAGRAALLMPTAFALGGPVLGKPVLATFAALGSFAMLLLVDFGGSIRNRLQCQAALAVACMVLITVGTLVSRTTWLAAVVIGILAFGVLFAGVASSVLAGASLSLLLPLIIAVNLPGPASSIPDRIEGWGLASLLSLFAISVLWPAPARDPVRSSAVAACRALATRLRVEIDFVLAGREGGNPVNETDYRHALAASDAAVEAVQTGFFATPYRPTGLSTSARAVVRLVDELRWLNTIVLHSALTAPRAMKPIVEVCEVKRAAADVLACAADLLETPGSAGPLDAATARLRAALEKLEEVSTARIPESADDARHDMQEHARRVVSALDPSFRSQELSFIVLQIATNVDYAARAERRTWLQKVLGRQPAGFVGFLSAASQRAGSHTARDSVWLHNSVRGAAGLGVAVLVADLLAVQHSFWVALATISVLRSSALNTGQNIVRAVLGTTVGLVIGGGIVALVGTNTAVLWVVLPFAVLLAGLAPATVSFEAGQAAFTLTLMILFNLIAPAGWQIGLVRIEDIALGGAVSLVVGLMLWPRGAGVALGRALSAAYVDSVSYLTSAVAYGLGRCDSGSPAPGLPVDQAVQAAAAARRLDDTFRGYLAERGAKPVPLGEVTALVTGVVGLRLAGDAVLQLWDGDGPNGGDRAAARRALLSGSDTVRGWYARFAESLVGQGGVPEPLGDDAVADGRLVDAVGRDLRDEDGHATATAVRVIWTGDHLDAVRRLQGMLVGPAQAAVAQNALSGSG
ncbi:MAG TPA: FUSC family protein [Solirubrobacteraceae bacterium]|nr:FUSC family protein [Solirubrobacteraceae bacterium]